MATAAYGVVLGMAAVGYELTERAIISCAGRDSALARAVGSNLKGKGSLALYLIVIPTAFYARPISLALYVGVLLLWLVPDRRIERALND